MTDEYEMTPPKPRKVKLVGRRDKGTGNYI